MACFRLDYLLELTDIIFSQFVVCVHLLKEIQGGSKVEADCEAINNASSFGVITICVRKIIKRFSIRSFSSEPGKECCTWEFKSSWWDSYSQWETLSWAWSLSLSMTMVKNISSPEG